MKLGIEILFKNCVLLKLSSRNAGVFNGRIGQILADLSSPVRPFKFFEIFAFFVVLLSAKPFRADTFGGAAKPRRSCGAATGGRPARRS